VLLVDDEKRDPPLQCAALPFVPPSMLDPSKALEESGKILNFLAVSKNGGFREGVWLEKRQVAILDG
jgi:hypothetical protein